MVHVFGAPEQPMRPDERLCTARDAADALVLFHPAAELIGPLWRCPDCGEINDEPA